MYRWFGHSMTAGLLRDIVLTLLLQVAIDGKKNVNYTGVNKYSTYGVNDIASEFDTESGSDSVVRCAEFISKKKITGVYEAAIRKLCENNGIYPKVVASTATIRNAKEQIKEFLKEDETMLMECLVDPMDLV